MPRPARSLSLLAMTGVFEFTTLPRVTAGKNIFEFTTLPRVTAGKNIFEFTTLPRVTAGKNIFFKFITLLRVIVRTYYSNL